MNDVNLVSEGFVGKFPIRQDITVLPPNDPNAKTELKTGQAEVCLGEPDPKNLLGGWKIYEEMATSNNCFDHSNKAYETDVADQFFDHCRGKGEMSKNRAWTSIEVLEFLKGKPWNNLALNALMALRPSVIRVTTGCVTLDAVTWRVTVFLDEKDKRTIRKITQEVEVGTIGCKTGHDFDLKVRGIPLPEPSDEMLCYYNEEALKKVRI